MKKVAISFNEVVQALSSEISLAKINRLFGKDYMITYEYSGSDLVLGYLLAHIEKGFLLCPIMQVHGNRFYFNNVRMVSGKDLGILEECLALTEKRKAKLQKIYEGRTLSEDYDFEELKELLIERDINCEVDLSEMLHHYVICYGGKPQPKGHIVFQLSDYVSYLPFVESSFQLNFEQFDPMDLTILSQEQYEEIQYSLEEEKRALQFILEKQRLRRLFQGEKERTK